jgi:hypothetical protein
MIKHLCTVSEVALLSCSWYNWYLYRRYNFHFDPGRSAVTISLHETEIQPEISQVRGPFEKFVDTYSESELCGGAVTVYFSKYLPWQALHFLQRSTHFSKTCCRPFAASFRRIVEQAVLTS